MSDLFGVESVRPVATVWFEIRRDDGFFGANFTGSGSKTDITIFLDNPVLMKYVPRLNIAFPVNAGFYCALYFSLFTS